MPLDMKTLVGHMNSTTKKALNDAAELGLQQAYFTVEVVHYLYCLLKLPNTDVSAALKAHGVNTDALLEEFRHAVEASRRGNTRTPSLSPEITDLLERAYHYAQGPLGQEVVRSAAILQVALETPSTKDDLAQLVPMILDVPVVELSKSWKDILPRSQEKVPSALDQQKANAAEMRTREKRVQAAKKEEEDAKPSEGEEALEQYTVSLTDQAVVGAIDPIVGRDGEIRQMIDILMRRRQNNPILTGEAGVGKTAVVEGLAQLATLRRRG